MSTARNIWVEAVCKLLRLTQEREIVWEVQEPPFLFSKRPNFRVEVVFVCKYGNRNLRLYEKRVLGDVENLDEFELSPVNNLEWKKVVVLEFFDAKGNGLWAFPSVEALNDLFSSVQFQVAGVNDFLTELLAS